MAWLCVFYEFVVTKKWFQILIYLVPFLELKLKIYLTLTNINVVHVNSTECDDMMWCTVMMIMIMEYVLWWELINGNDNGDGIC